MTKKHFEALADALYATKPRGEAVDVPALLGQWRKDQVGLMDVCGATNAQFDRSRFAHRALHGHNLTKTCCKGA